MNARLEAAFEAIWRGDTAGWSEHNLAHELVALDRLSAALHDGAVKPSSIIEGARSRASAETVLATRREHVVRALASRGRTHPENIANAAGPARPSTWFCACTSWENPYAGERLTHTVR